MQRPWVQPAEVKEYSESAKVAARSDVRLAYDIARAERYGSDQGGRGCVAD